MSGGWKAVDPRASLLLALLWSAGLVVATPTLCLLALVPILVLVATALPASRLLRLARGVAILWFLTVATNAVFTGGDRLGPEGLGWFRPSAEGLRNGLLQGARLAGLAALAAWLTSTVGALELASSLEWSVRGSAALRRMVHRATLPLVLALRLVPAMGEEAGRLLEVDRLRAGPGSRRAPLGRLPRLFPLWLVGVVERGEQLSLALTLRGYRPEATRGFSRGFRFQLRDGAVALGGVLGFVLLVVR